MHWYTNFAKKRTKKFEGVRERDGEPENLWFEIYK
jgi:hypothetical protein